MKTLIQFAIVLTLLTAIGCNKTGIKGTVIYGPTNSPIEDIEVSIIPRNNTEENSSYIKKGISDKNGVFKITGLEVNATYNLFVKNDKYCTTSDAINPITVRASVKDQTNIINTPVKVKDILPGQGCYVKKLKGGIYPLAVFGLFQQTTINYYGFADLDNGGLVHNPVIYYTDDVTIKNANPTKVNNGDIIYFNIQSVWDWHVSPLEKYTFNNNCESLVKSFNISDMYIPSGIYFEMVNKYNDTFLGFKRMKQVLPGSSTSLYYLVSLKKGYYLVSSCDYSYTNSRVNTRNLKNFIIEVVEGTENINEENIEGD